MTKKKTVLLIDTITKHAALHIWKEQKVYSVSFGETRSYSKDLIRHFERALKKSKGKPEELTGVVVLTGPGSYTSIRIGVSFANALGYGLNIPVVGKTLFEAVRLHASRKDPVVVEAGRGNVFVQKGKQETVLAATQLSAKKYPRLIGLEVTPELAATLGSVNLLDIPKIHPEKIFAATTFLKSSRRATPHYVIPPHISKRKKRKLL